MAVDILNISRTRDSAMTADVDPRVMQRLVLIVGLSLAFLVVVKIGMFSRVMP